MRRAGLLTLLAALVLALPDRGVASPVDHLHPIDLRVNGGGEGWHSDHLFKLSWEPPRIAAGTPITAVGYRLVYPTGAVVYERRLAWSSDSIDIEVGTAPGVYTAEVWLEGHHEERGPVVSAPLRYDPARPGTPRASGPRGWVAGQDAASISIEPPSGSAPVSGIRGYAVSIDRGGEIWPCGARDRCGDSDLDLADGAAATLSLGTLPEGLAVARVVTVSGAGVPSAEAAVAVVRVDATRPEVTLTGAPDGWVNHPVGVVATASDPLSGMGSDGPNGAFTAIVVDGGVPRAEPGDRASAAVTGEGVHRVGAYARDVAGNVDPRRPRTITVAIDESPPRVSFVNREDPAEPERIEASIADSLSGIDAERGSIAVREAGTSRSWRPLPTKRFRDRLVARWDSDSDPRGVYEFQAVAHDLAGNSGSSIRRANQARMVLVNPLKRRSLLRAGFGASGSAAKTLPYGRQAAYRGRLTTAAGAPLGGLPVSVVETFASGAVVRERSTRVMTAADGSFALRLPAGPSREVATSFAGTGTLSRSGSDPARLGVLAALRLGASSRQARVGGAPVVFSGRVRRRGARLPAGGLPVELQFRIPGGEWTEFRTLRTDPGGRFRYPYAFSDDDSRGVRFQFRAYISRGGWPYEPAASKAVSVTGR